MANPTTNFGWVMPTSTDLVTDLPAVDTSMADLKGGTTGQVLAKATNTDMDFTWVAQDDSNAIQNTIVDAKGDLIAASASDVPARLAVGANGETLVADSSASTGLRYQTGVNDNGIINGGMDIWQKGATPAVSTTANNVSTADRWCARRYADGGGITVSRVSSGLDGFQYAARIQRTAGNTSTFGFYFFESIETAEAIKYAGKTVTVSFYLRKGADLSNAPVVYFTSGTGTDQNLQSFTGASNLVNGGALSPAASTSWQRYSFTVSVGSSATELGFQIYWEPSGTAGTNDYYDITGVQLELGSVATTFKRAGGTLQGELAACQRYYWLIGSGTSSVLGTGFYQSATRFHVPVIFPTTMRTAPSLVATSGTNYYNFQTGGDDNFNSLTIATPTTQSCYLYNLTEMSGTGGQAGTTLTNNASASVAFSAEL